jgi:hypothetical protein
MRVLVSSRGSEAGGPLRIARSFHVDEKQNAAVVLGDPAKSLPHRQRVEQRAVYKRRLIGSGSGRMGTPLRRKASTATLRVIPSSQEGYALKRDLLKARIATAWAMPLASSASR